MRLEAQWTDDCQGKKDYDGDVLSVSTRYWPAGGGYHVLDAQGFHESADGSKPSARSSLIIRQADDESIELAARDFEGETFADVAAQVERWAQEQYEKAVAALRSAFPTTGNADGG